MNKSIWVMIGGLALLAGCGNQGGKSATTQAEPKWKGAPYRLAFDTQGAKPNPAKLTIPVVKYTANPDAVENRAILVLQFEASGPTTKEPVEKKMIGLPTDIHGTEGALPASYMEMASQSLSDYLADHCLNGNVKLSVALARSSLEPQADDNAITMKLLSAWLPTELTFKNPHAKCR